VRILQSGNADPLFDRHGEPIRRRATQLNVRKSRTSVPSFPKRRPGRARKAGGLLVLANSPKERRSPVVKAVADGHCCTRSDDIDQATRFGAVSGAHHIHQHGFSVIPSSSAPSNRLTLRTCCSESAIGGGRRLEVGRWISELGRCTAGADASGTQIDLHCVAPGSPPCTDWFLENVDACAVCTAAQLDSSIQEGCPGLSGCTEPDVVKDPHSVLANSYSKMPRAARISGSFSLDGGGMNACRSWHGITSDQERVRASHMTSGGPLECDACGCETGISEGRSSRTPSRAIFGMYVRLRSHRPAAPLGKGGRPQADGRQLS
jgi:hypothetical protein